MPTYEYACAACGHEFELFQNISEKPTPRTCPKCRRRRAKRLISSGGGILFRGSGFYETDYRSDTYKKQEQAESGQSKGGSKGDGEKKSSDSSTGEKSSKSSDKPAKKSGAGGSKSSSKKK